MKTLIVVVISKQRTIGATLIITLAVALGVIIAVATAVARIDIDAPAWVARVRCGYAVAISVVVAVIIVWLTLALPLLIIRVVAGAVIPRTGRHALRQCIERLARRCPGYGIKRAIAAGNVALAACKRHARGAGKTHLGLQQAFLLDQIPQRRGMGAR